MKGGGSSIPNPHILLITIHRVLRKNHSQSFSKHRRLTGPVSDLILVEKAECITNKKGLFCNILHCLGSRYERICQILISRERHPRKSITPRLKLYQRKPLSPPSLRSHSPLHSVPTLSKITFFFSLSNSTAYGIGGFMTQ